ncbi:NrdH-redoxin [Acaricomes phytoseiuli]|uniref:glutaredoxin domain-containing protein n=1 Tax=Acaricomes phytoseiuli TaxID=291968 RepID=UPI00038049A9|nr:glutaredoxin domain-containing protein [Acaricomes phytoseiuli]MCW1249321.1 NrdH-redoxin [Acaricomes phytoseiuli]
MTELKLADYIPQAGQLTIFSTLWCGFCTNLKAELDAQGVLYQDFNLGFTDGAAELVQELNQGEETVPTVIFPDGSSATNPSLNEVMQRLGG